MGMCYPNGKILSSGDIFPGFAFHFKNTNGTLKTGKVICFTELYSRNRKRSVMRECAETPEMSNKQIIWLPELGQLVTGENNPIIS